MSPDVQTVLLVERDVLARATIAEYLRHCGFVVLQAVDTDEALTVLQERPVDVLLVDVEASGAVNGFGLARWVRENKGDVAIVLAGSPEQAAREMHNLCESVNLTKPYEMATLLQRIQELLKARKR